MDKEHQVRKPKQSPLRTGSNPDGKPPAVVLAQDVREALEVVEEIDETVDQVSDRAKSNNAEFFESVLEKSKAIGETIRRTNSVSPAQRSALDNMLKGVDKWVHD